MRDHNMFQDEETPKDDWFAKLAEMDQGVAMWASVVPGLYSMFRASVDAGFTEEQAMHIMFFQMNQGS